MSSHINSLQRKEKHRLRWGEGVIEIFLLISLILSGCGVKPSENAARDAITKHFESRRYKVIELHINNIESLPLSEREYMETKGYLIHINSIVLEVANHAGEASIYKKGQHLTFKNGTIKIMSAKSINKNQEEWSIANISGIPVP